jgi:hypothetical protein
MEMDLHRHSAAPTGVQLVVLKVDPKAARLVVLRVGPKVAQLVVLKGVQKVAQLVVLKVGPKAAQLVVLKVGPKAAQTVELHHQRPDHLIQFHLQLALQPIVLQVLRPPLQRVRELLRKRLEALQHHQRQHQAYSRPVHSFLHPVSVQQMFFFPPWRTPHSGHTARLK